MGSLEKFLGKTKEITIDGDKVTLHPLKVKEMVKFNIKDPTSGQEMDLAKEMVKISVHGETEETIDNLPLGVFRTLVEEISKFNGFTDERATKIKDVIRARKSGN